MDGFSGEFSNNSYYHDHVNISTVTCTSCYRLGDKRCSMTASLLWRRRAVEARRQTETGEKKVTEGLSTVLQGTAEIKGWPTREGIGHDAMFTTDAENWTIFFGLFMKFCVHSSSADRMQSGQLKMWPISSGRMVKSNEHSSIEKCVNRTETSREQRRWSLLWTVAVMVLVGPVMCVHAAGSQQEALRVKYIGKRIDKISMFNENTVWAAGSGQVFVYDQPAGKVSKVRCSCWWSQWLVSHSLW